MSGCGGNCGYGSSCKCGNGCGMYPDVKKNTTYVTIIEGVAPLKMHSEGSENNNGAEGGHACKCGSSCTCNPCNC